MEYVYNSVKFISDQKLTLEQQQKLLAKINSEIGAGDIVTEVRIHTHGGKVHYSVNLESAPVEHIRRITGYLVGTTDKFNDAKKAEEQDRVKHV